MATKSENITKQDITLLADSRKKDQYSVEEITNINNCINKIKDIGSLICEGNSLSYRLAGNIPWNFKNHVHNIWIKIWHDDYAYCKDRIFYTLGLFKPEEGSEYILLLRMDHKHTGDYEPSQNILNLKKDCYIELGDGDFKSKTLEELANKAKEKIKEWEKKFSEYAMAVDSEILISDVSSRLIDKYNIILTGAPGTGKTYLAKEIASNLIESGKAYNELSDEQKKQIGFVQFHPSYDYSDFVEGLRSYEKAGGTDIGFRRQDGVFKTFCKKALMFRNTLKQIIRQQYCYMESTLDAFPLSVIYSIASGVDKTLQMKNYIFIIDEINRGELSKIFGELFYSIDPGYRGKNGEVKTQYQNLVDFEVDDKGNKTNNEDIFKNGFFVPENVYIIGTMNDIDRSVEPMDFAVRRRFVWIDIKPEDRISMWGNNQWRNQAMTIMSNINIVICSIEALGEPYCIGPAYFNNPPLNDSNISNDLWTLRLEPILKEYLRIIPKEEAKDYMSTFKYAFEADEIIKKTKYEDIKKELTKK